MSEKTTAANSECGRAEGAVGVSAGRGRSDLREVGTSSHEPPKGRTPRSLIAIEELLQRS
jgi:hypothetical protein